LDANPKKNPIFDALVKNFSQMAYINNGEKGLELYPNSAGGADGDSEGEEHKEGQDNGEDDIGAKKSKLARLFMHKKPEANDGDIENFYSTDPSKVYFLNQIYRQA
jgi:hypothetical protein